MPPKIPGFDDTEETAASTSRASPEPTSGLDKGKSRAIESLDSDLEGSELDDETCAICLSTCWNRAEASPCHHNAFCFACLLTWCGLSRRCPLCNTVVDFLMTHVRSETDFQKHHLLPLAGSRGPADPPVFPAAADIDMATRRQLFKKPRRKHEWGRRNRREALDELEEEELALQRRKWIYKHKLFAKHVASNAYTRYQSFTPSQFASSQDRKSRVVRFARRELQVFPSVDVEWLCQYLLQIMCQLDLRSDNAIRLLAEFLGFDQAEHFAHEVLTFARSPFTDLQNWDRFTQYDRPECREPSPPVERRPLSPERPPARRPLSPDPYRDREMKRRRPSDGYAPRYVDRYVPDYSREPPRYRSPPLRQRSRSLTPPRRQSPPAIQVDSITPPRDLPRAEEPSFSPPPQSDRAPEVNRVIVLTDDEDNISLGDFKTPPLPESSEKGISLKGLANANARRESLQARLEAEKAEAEQRKVSEASRRKAALAEKLRKEKAESAEKATTKQQGRDSLKAKLMARLEEEKQRALRDAKETKGRSAAFGGGTAWQNDAWNAAAEDAETSGSGYNREDELRRALEARAALGKKRIDPKARLLAQMSDMEARLQSLRQQIAM